MVCSPFGHRPISSPALNRPPLASSPALTQPRPASSPARYRPRPASFPARYQPRQAWTESCRAVHTHWRGRSRRAWSRRRRRCLGGRRRKKIILGEEIFAEKSIIILARYKSVNLEWKQPCLDVLEKEYFKRERKACKRRRACSRISSRTKSSLKEKKSLL